MTIASRDDSRAAFDGSHRKRSDRSSLCERPRRALARFLTVAVAFAGLAGQAVPASADTGEPSPLQARVDGKATFLHTVSDAPLAPTIVDLAAAGIEPNDVLSVRYAVPAPGFSFYGCGGPFVSAERTPLVGVFSASATLLGPSTFARVPDAIDAGADFVTGPTYFGGRRTDIPEDFRISPPTGFRIKVPEGATRLFLGMADSLFRDNCGVAIVTLEVADTTPPETNASISPEPNAAGWHREDPTVVLAASDEEGGSGVKEITYRMEGAQTSPSTTVDGDEASLTVTAEGETTITYGATDHAGNTSEPKTLKLNVDKTAPALKVPDAVEMNATSPSGATVSYSFSAEDNLDPDPTAECRPASGRTFPIGSTTVECAARDVAGNEADKSFEVVVKGAREQVIDLMARVVNMGLQRGMHTSLTSKLKDGLAAIDADDVPRACEKLEDFGSQARALSGKKLTSDQADELIAAATRIRAVLAC